MQHAISHVEAVAPHPIMSCYSMSAVRDNDLFSDAGDAEDQGTFTVATEGTPLEMTSPTDSMSSL